MVSCQQMLSHACTVTVRDVDNPFRTVCKGNYPVQAALAPASEHSFLYSPPPEPHHCLCQNTAPELSAPVADAGGWHWHNTG